MGWVIQQHGAIYAKEYGWNWEFEALVASICADFVKNFQPERELCCIAELDGQRVGSIFVMKKDAQTAQFRMLILPPEARGLGLGKRLSEAAIAFARAKDFSPMVLWTNVCLLAARGIYEDLGFVRQTREAYQGLSHDLIGETWALKL